MNIFIMFLVAGFNIFVGVVFSNEISIINYIAAGWCLGLITAMVFN